MGVDVKDHRRLLRSVEEKDAAEAKSQPKPLMQQVQIASETGDPRLDKLMRATASLIEKSDAICVQAALDAMGCLKPEMFLLKQLEFAFTKGRISAFHEVIQLPAQIIMEEKGNPNVTQ